MESSNMCLVSSADNVAVYAQLTCATVKIGSTINAVSLTSGDPDKLDEIAVAFTRAAAEFREMKRNELEAKASEVAAE